MFSFSLSALATVVLCTVACIHLYRHLSRVDHLDKEITDLRARYSKLQELTVDTAELSHRTTRAVVGALSILERYELLKKADAELLPSPYKDVFGVDLDPKTNPNVVYWQPDKDGRKVELDAANDTAEAVHSCAGKPCPERSGD
jgi:hypothetical protein